MIGKLSGKIDSVSGSHVILDVNGVGYVVSCSARTLRELGAIGDLAVLHIETQVREDAINLFGFIDTLEQEWFKLLTTVQGVGAKVGLAILGAVSPEQLISAIASQDKAALSRADGVGPKLALRLVTELKDKVPAFMASADRGTLSKQRPSAAQGSSVASDALSALVNLGYSRLEAYTALCTVHQRHPEAKLDELIRHSLAELSKRDYAA
jgi:Holliday junction DNA helicase RuvA